MDAIKSKLQPEGITKMIIVFSLDTDKYNVMLSKEDNTKPLKLEISQKEISLIKLIFINKIKRKVEKETKGKVKSIIVEIDFLVDEFNIFIQDEKLDVTKFKY